MGTTEISHMYINKASSKGVTCHHFIGLNDEGNTKEVFQGQQTNTFCLFDNFILTMDHVFLSNQSYSHCLPLDQSVDK